MCCFGGSILTVFLCLFSCKPGFCQVRTDNVTGHGKIPLHLMTLYSQGENWDGSGAVVAMELAFEVVNNSTDILPGYELKPIWNDTKCSSGLAARSFFHLIHTHPQKIAMLGPPCSDASPVLEASQYWNLVSMGYSAEGEALSDKKKFPLFFRTNPIVNGKEHIPLTELIRRYGLKQAALVVETHSVIPSIELNVHQLLSDAGVNAYSEYVSPADSVQSQVENIRERGIKVVFMFTIEGTTQRLFCEFLHQDWYGEGFAWFIPHYFRSHWWEFPNEDLDCTQDEMRTVVGGAYYLISRPLLVPRTNSEIISHFTVDKFNAEILQRMSWPKYTSRNVSLSGYEKFAFDAVWALALMLNQSAQVLETKVFEDGKRHRLEEFTYEDSEMAELFVLTLLQDVKFLGFSGDVYFTEDENDDRFKLFEILQMQGVCDTGWSVNLTDCYQAFAGETVWQDAHEACQNISGDLVAIHSWKELEFVSSLWKYSENVSISQCWLAASDYLTGLDRTDEIMSQTGCIYFDFALNISSIGDCHSPRPFICKKKAGFALQSLGWYDDKDGNMTLYQDIIWPGGVVPAAPNVKPSPGYSYIEIMLPSILHIVITCAAVVGVMIALFFLFVSVYFSNHMFNYKLENLILLAAILTLLSAPLTTSEIFPEISDDSHLKVCYAQLWLESVAFVSGLGTIVTLLWRVYRMSILTNLDRTPGDLKLFITVLMLLAADVGFLVGHIFISPFKIVNVTVSTDKMDSSDASNVIIKFTTTCVSSGRFFHIMFVVTDKILLVLACLFLTYETRMAENSCSSNTKWLVISFYNITIFSTIRFALMFLLRSDPIIQYMFQSSLNIICATATVCIIFIPKVLFLCGVSTSTPPSADERPPHIVSTSSHISQADEYPKQIQTMSLNIRRRDQYILRVPPALKEENLHLLQKLKQLERLVEEKVQVHHGKPAV